MFILSEFEEPFPSVTMIVYASLSNLSIGKMFLASVVPGFLLAGLFMSYILIRSLIDPTLAPPIPIEERVTWAEKFASIKNLAMPFVLIFSIMGTIFSGLAPPMEAAAVGAFVSMGIVLIRERSGKNSSGGKSHRSGKTSGGKEEYFQQLRFN